MSTHAASYAAHIANTSAHHTKYTDAEVDAILGVHTAIGAAHHTKYTDAEAVSAVDAGDDYVKNDEDDKIDLTSGSEVHFGVSPVTGATERGIDIKTVTNCAAGFVLDSRYGSGVDCKCVFAAGSKFWWQVWPSTGVDDIFTLLWFDGVWPAKGNDTYLMKVSKTDVNWYGLIMKDMKNHAHSALSGTRKLVEIDIGGTPYYFEVYPTKA
jgi:hypothetical protein